MSSLIQYEYPDGVQSSVASVLSNAYNGYNIRILGDKATLAMQTEHAYLYAESLDREKGIVDGVTCATKAYPLRVKLSSFLKKKEKKN